MAAADLTQRPYLASAVPDLRPIPISIAVFFGKTTSCPRSVSAIWPADRIFVRGSRFGCGLLISDLGCWCGVSPRSRRNRHRLLCCNGAGLIVYNEGSDEFERVHFPAYPHKLRLFLPQKLKYILHENYAAFKFVVASDPCCFTILL